MLKFVLKAVCVAIVVLTGTSVHFDSEDARVKNWQDSGNAWPPLWQKESWAFRETQRKHEEEIMQLTGAGRCVLI